MSFILDQRWSSMFLSMDLMLWRRRELLGEVSLFPIPSPVSITIANYFLSIQVQEVCHTNFPMTIEPFKLTSQNPVPTSTNPPERT